MNNLNKFYQEYKNNSFFEDKRYEDIFSDSNKLSSLFTQYKQSKIALQLSSPYFLMTCLIACHFEKITAILLPTSKKANDLTFYEQIVSADNTFTDLDISNHLSQFSETQNIIDYKNKLSSFDNAPFIIVFTSGTSENPKGIVLSMNNIFYSAKGFIDFFDQTSKDLTLINLPHHHVGGLMSIWRAFFSGGEITKTLTDKISFTSLVPTQLFNILSDETQISIFSKIRCILIGGAFFNDDLKNKAKESNLKCFETYGMTETTSLLSVNGEVLPYRKLHLDEDGSFVVDGEILAQGFYKNNIFYEIKRPFKTNDQGRINNNGRFSFIQRSDLIFVSGGENINPLVVESLIIQHPQIAQCYLVSIKDNKWGELGILLYDSISDVEISHDEIKKFCANKIPHYMVPKQSFKVNLSKNSNEKINRSSLKIKAIELYYKSIFNHDFIDHKSNVTLVFFHGFLGCKDDFKFWIPHNRNQFNLLFIDLPGHGNSLIKNFYNLSEIFNRLKLFIELFGNQFIFFGYSMGGRIALELSLNYLKPEVLILESTNLGLETQSQKDTRYKTDLELFNNYDQSSISQFLIHWYEQEIFGDYKTIEKFSDDINAKSNHDIAEWKNAITILSPSQFPLKDVNLEKLSKVKYPVHYIFGSYDKKYAIEPTDYLQIHPIPKAAHNPHKTHENQLVKILSKILSQLTS